MPPVPPASAAPFPAVWMAAWLDQSHDLLALTDRHGALQWTNPAFERATGLAAGAALWALAPAAWRHGAPRAALAAAHEAGTESDTEHALQGASGAELWVRMRVTRVGEARLWTFQDTTQGRALAAEAQHLSELLDMAQEFGRLGVWERDIPSGKGRWDRHVFGFWGMQPTPTAPDHRDASARIHPDDQNSCYLDSTRQAGRYAQHYRVLRDDGSVRWIHSQWEVKNGPDGQPVRTIGIMMDDTAVHELARSRDAAATQLRVVTSLANLVLWRHDLETDRIHYNDHGFKVLGVPYKAGGLTLEEARMPTHPDDAIKLAESSAHALATGVPVDLEVRHRRSDGAWRWILVRRVIERGTGGAPLAFVGVSLDVTERVEQGRRAEQLASRLEAAAEAARVGIWTAVIGTRETEWNAQMYELFELSEAQGPPTLGEWLTHCVHPDDLDRVAQTTRAFMRHQVSAIELEFRVRRRDGSTRWMVLRGDVDRSPDTGRAFGIAMDITDRHEALLALHAASERSALIARHAGIGTWETDDDGRPLWDEQMWRLRGLQPRPVALNQMERLASVHPDDRARLLDADPEAVASGHVPTAYEFRVLLPDGTYRWLASRSAALLDERGGLLRRVGVNWDITESKNADLARQKALLAERESRAKSQFLSRMSHELRTPLNAMLGFTQLLQLEGRQGADPGQLARLEHIRTAGEHLLALIDDALDLSGLQTGTLQLELRPVALEALLAQALTTATAAATGRGVTLRILRIAPVMVRADAARLRQVLTTLLDNAIHHNERDGQITVDSRSDSDQVVLSVGDTGRGMTEAQLAALFEPFSDLGPRNDATSGSGIGLAIARALVQSMGGSISATSQLGRGTTIEIRLPQAQTVATPPILVRTGFEQGAPARRGQLLYIEDNSVNVLLVEELVRSLSGLSIVSEPTGAAGVARARTLRPNLILIDMHLPDFDGFEVLRRLRSAPETATIPCIALSANAIPEDIERALSGGFDDYWTKPIKFKPFLQALERLFPGVAS